MSEKKPQKSTTPSARKPVAPRKRDYSYKEEGRSQFGVRDTDYTLKPGVQVRTENPRVWEKGGRFVFRPLPMVDSETGEEEAYRIDSEPGNFSDFFRSYPIVQFMGIDQQFDFIPHRKSKSYNPAKQNPYVILRNAIIDAVENGTAPTAKWAPLVSAKNRKAPLPKPKMRYYFQGPVYENVKPLTNKDGSKLQPSGLGERDLPTLVYLSGSAGDAIIDKLNERKPGYRGDESDFEASMLYGDPVISTGGRFISLWNPEMYSPNASVPSEDDGEEVEGDISTGDEDKGGRGGNEYAKGYEVEIMEAYRPRPKLIYRPSMERYPHMLGKVVQWDDVIHIPTHEQLCFWIAQALRSMPELMKFGWQDHPEFFTSDVRSVLGISKTFAVSAGRLADEDEEQEGDEYGPEGEEEEADVSSDALDEDADVTSEDEDGDAYDAEEYEGDEDEDTEDDDAIDDSELGDDDDEEEDDGSDHGDTDAPFDTADEEVSEDEEEQMAAKFSKKTATKTATKTPAKKAGAPKRK